MVVLSACESGSGGPWQEMRSAGLATALLLAGVRSVVASLWPVDDAATAFLMGFYKALQTGLDVPEALASATQMVRQQPGWMIHIIGRGSSPFSEGYLIEQRAGVRRITCKPLGGRCQLVEVDTVTDKRVTHPGPSCL